MAVLFVFIDGVGVGRKSEHNPLSDSALKAFSFFTESDGLHDECEELREGAKLFIKIDANLGVDGLPQSGTGQASLFSGENASKIAGKHFGPFPYSSTKVLLKERSLFHKVIEEGYKPHFLNAYPDIFFKKSEKRDRWTCTTLMAKSAGIRLNGIEDIIKKRALTAEIVQSSWKRMLNLKVPEITPEEASGRALKQLNRFDLVLYEYYLTDKAGHEMNRNKAVEILTNLDRFLMGIVQHLNSNDTLVITSDHGNLEDLTVKTHTRNPVPLFVLGDTEPFVEAESILDITPSIIDVLKRGEKR